MTSAGFAQFVTVRNAGWQRLWLKKGGAGSWTIPPQLGLGRVQKVMRAPTCMVRMPPAESITPKSELSTLPLMPPKLT